jgi:6,7-dimethyl-8-ribityllumazine synthase
MSGQGRPDLAVVDAADLALAIACTRWHPEITDSLLERAAAAAKACGVSDVVTVRTAGAVELPVVAQELAKHYDAVVCLGAVIRGGTPHFEYVASEAAKGVAQAGMSTGQPVIFGIITADTLEQAIERAGTKAGNKGWQAALAAIEMADLFTKI